MKTIQLILVAVITFATALIASAAPAGEAPRHYVVTICGGLSPSQSQGAFKQSMDLLLNHAQPGDRVEFLAGAAGQPPRNGGCARRNGTRPREQPRVCRQIRWLGSISENVRAGRFTSGDATPPASTSRRGLPARVRAKRSSRWL
jgi:hypothetical protein